ncbi:uncharacterized protein SCHCODRAFT_02723103 [Schizophyllum commune H4-8]|nr:uncharacterized protein SCHCODRAFT_02723103 [Schizophyllum commune H4-8]KAI5898923.1 hypothetical protein SCHCODRAFT_02723103 [Schizophyllum commune H4-8]
MSATIDKLPTEILFYISEWYSVCVAPLSTFSLSAPYDEDSVLRVGPGIHGRLPICGASVLRAVSRRWCVLADASSSLWATIFLYHPSDFGIQQLTKYLDRAGQRPMTLHFTEELCSKAPVASIQSLVSILADERYILRWKELEMSFQHSQPEVSLEAFAHFFSAARSPTSLERFALRIGSLVPYMLEECHTNALRAIWTTALTRAPNLKAIDCTGAFPLLPPVPTNSLRRLRHIVTDCNVDDDSSPLRNLMALLTACPELEVLDIVDLVEDSAAYDKGSAIAPVVNKHLHTFRARACWIPPVFASLVRMPSLRRLDLVDECVIESKTLCEWLYFSHARLEMLHLEETEGVDGPSLGKAVNLVDVDILKDLRVLCITVPWWDRHLPKPILGLYIDACRSKSVTGYLDFEQAVDAYLTGTHQSHE